MRELRRSRLTDLLQLADGRILATSPQGDRYFLVDGKAGTTDSITLQTAALLWQQGEREQWERLDAPAQSQGSADLFGTAAQGDENTQSFRELLRERLGMMEDE